MFSCCRSNPTKKDKHKKGAADTEEETSAKNKTSKLVIPTITVENGKPIDDDDDDGTNNVNTKANTAMENIEATNNVQQHEHESSSLSSSSSSHHQIQDNDVVEVAIDASNQEQQASEDAADEKETAQSTVVNSVTENLAKTIQEIDNSSNEQQNVSNQPVSIKSTSSTTSNSISMTSVAVSLVNYATTTSDAGGDPSQLQSEPKPPTSDRIRTASTVSTDGVTPTRSCLSRHNSTHMSIKKKVNISTRAEIIEPEPLMQKTPSLGDDDDVFSDSMPAPKRENMCAPYIEPNERIPETVAFSHGLPAWFDDERLSEIGCIEPPVTPVGRDELELKRQRLYTDLLRAAHAAVEHSVRFTPFCAIGAGASGAGGASNAGISLAEASVYNFQSAETTTAAAASAKLRTGACDPDLQPSVAENLENLVNRLELLVERLERSVSARELEIANRVFDTVLERKRESVDCEQDLPLPLPSPPPPSATVPPSTVDSLAAQLGEQTDKLSQRIERIEASLQRINERHQSVSSGTDLSSDQDNNNKELSSETVVRLIPTTVLPDQFIQSVPEDIPLPPPPPSMSVLGFQDIISGPLSQYLALSAKIGGDVAKHAELVKAAFDAQLQYVTLATQVAQPAQNKQMELLKPTSTQISAIQDYREKQRASPYFNHLSAISESIPALGWVCVAPTPGPHVKEMNDAGQFYTNRVLKEWKEKDAKHVEWARAWVQTLTELQAYIKQYHTTGLVWSGKGAAPAGGAPPPPPPAGGCPPPPPSLDFSALKLNSAADDRSALFASINQGENVTKNLKKVTSDMQTHKNPTLRSGPAPFKTPANVGSVSGGSSGPVVKDPVFTRDGKKWLIEYQRNNTGLVVENAEMNNVVYMFKCEGSTLTVKGKVNNIVLDSCKKCSLLFDSVVASVEFVNCQSVQMQTLGFVPTVTIDKTDGCQMYLSKDSLGVEIVSSKSSEMNILLPEQSGDYTELAVPEQYKTTISGKTLKTVCVDSLG